MNCIHITHPELEPVEFFFCYFNTEKDLKDFAATCEWFKPEDISIYPAEKCVIKYDKEAGYYEKLTTEYFKRTLGKRLEVWSAVLRQAEEFF